MEMVDCTPGTLTIRHWKRSISLMTSYSIHPFGIVSAMVRQDVHTNGEPCPRSSPRPGCRAEVRTQLRHARVQVADLHLRAAFCIPKASNKAATTMIVDASFSMCNPGHDRPELLPSFRRAPDHSFPVPRLQVHRRERNRKQDQVVGRSEATRDFAVRATPGSSGSR